MKRLVIVSGLSGAGKTTTLHTLEDLGFFVVDNTPPSLWGNLTATLVGGGVQAVALAIDIRAGPFLVEAVEGVTSLRKTGWPVEVLFLDTPNEILLGRFNLTRRTHPLNEGSLSEDLDRERTALLPLRSLADTLLDTSTLSVQELTNRIQDRFAAATPFTLRLVSFGFKRGLPRDADVVLDARTLPNPFYDPILCSLPGTDPGVQARIFSPQGLEFYGNLRSTVRMLAGRAASSGRQGYTIAIGCTGGQHRSVAVADRLGHDLAKHFRVKIDHRDLDLALAEHQV